MGLFKNVLPFLLPLGIKEKSNIFETEYIATSGLIRSVINGFDLLLYLIFIDNYV